MGKFQKIIPENVNVIGIEAGELKKLNITCSSTKCNDGLHCFSRFMKNAEKKYNKKGVCYNCGYDSIDWNRIHKNDINDAKYIFESLNKELMRKLFSTMKIESDVIDIVKLHLPNVNHYSICVYFVRSSVSNLYITKNSFCKQVKTKLHY